MNTDGKILSLLNKTTYGQVQELQQKQILVKGFISLWQERQRAQSVSYFSVAEKKQGSIKRYSELLRFAGGAIEVCFFETVGGTI